MYPKKTHLAMSNRERFQVRSPVPYRWVGQSHSAQSKVTVLVSGRHYDSGYQEVMQLTEVTLDGVRYDLRTDQVPVPPGSITEAAFTLLKDLQSSVEISC